MQPVFEEKKPSVISTRGNKKTHISNQEHKRERDTSFEPFRWFL
jgi:hypothetical protein